VAHPSGRKAAETPGVHFRVVKTAEHGCPDAVRNQRGREDAQSDKGRR
jgi:hypothetical protein